MDIHVATFCSVTAHGIAAVAEICRNGRKLCATLCAECLGSVSAVPARVIKMIALGMVEQVTADYWAVQRDTPVC